MHDYTKSISLRMLGSRRIVARAGQSFAVVEDSNIAHRRFNFQPSRSSLALHSQRLLRYHAHQKSVQPSVHRRNCTSGTVIGNTSDQYEIGRSKLSETSLRRHLHHPPAVAFLIHKKIIIIISSFITPGTRLHGPHPQTHRVQCDGQDSTGLEPLANQRLVSLAFSACYSFSFSEPETRAGGATAILFFHSTLSSFLSFLDFSLVPA